MKPTGGQDIDARYRTRKGRVDRVDRVDVPKLGYATVDGAGGPDGESIADAVSAPTGAVLVVGEVPDVLARDVSALRRLTAGGSGRTST